jgi:hypothetical protein
MLLNLESLDATPFGPPPRSVFSVLGVPCVTVNAISLSNHYGPDGPARNAP